MQARTHTLRNGNTVLIRSAIPDDAPAILAFLTEASTESDNLTFGPGEFEFTEPEERTFIRSTDDSHTKLFAVAVMGDMLVGMLTFSSGERRRIRHTGELGLIVGKTYWGLGIGSLLLDALVAWARHGGVVTKLNLRVRTDHRRAIALYERKGFVREGTISRAIRIEGQDFDQYWMGLTL